jgi:HlyD family secretion protein
MPLLKRAQDALEQRVQASSHDETALQQSRFWMRAITWGLVGTASFGVSWLALAQTEEIVVAQGKLEPIGSVKEIQMPVGGVAAAILVKDGQQVKAGEVLMRLDTEATSQRSRNLGQSLDLKQKQLGLKQLELQRYLAMNREETVMLTKKLELERQILSRFASLAKVGASAELQVLQQRNTVQEAEGRLQQSKLDRFRQEAILSQQMQELESDQRELRSQITEAAVTLRYQALRSPVDGVVFDLKPKAAGYAAQSTEAVMKVVPFSALEARVQIPSSDIGFVRKGMPVDVSIDSFPATDFGVLQGSVRQLGSDALPPDPSRQEVEYLFPATIKLASQQLKLKGGQRLPLQVGMSLTANIKLRKVTYLQMLLGGFKDKANSLRRI